MRNFLDDVKNNGGYPRQVDKSGFELGKNIARDAGARRHAQRADRADRLRAADAERCTQLPLLCSPPWINKYYIMDLAPGRSFVEWAVKHGHQDFMISYRNPDESMSHYTMDDYLRRRRAGGARRGAGDYRRAAKSTWRRSASGGTLALIALAYLAAHGQGDRVA